MIVVAELFLERGHDLAAIVLDEPRGRRWGLRAFVLDFNLLLFRGLCRLTRRNFFSGGFAALLVFFVFCHESHSQSPHGRGG